MVSATTANFRSAENRRCPVETACSSDASTALSSYQMAHFASRTGAIDGLLSEPVTAEIDFDRDGKQHGFIRLPYSVHRSAYADTM